MFLVDVSLSSNPERFNVWLKMLDAVLKNNRDSLNEFAVVFFNIETFWWKREFTANTPQNVAALMKHCQTLSLEGATNLDRALKAAVQPSWLKRSAGQLHDLFLLSDAALTWGESDLHAITAPWRDGKAGPLFAYATGFTGTDTRVLAHLARETGGAIFSVVGEAEIAKASTAHRSRPWRLVKAAIDGGSDLLFAGRPRFVYPGQRLLLVGRGTPASGADVVLTLQRGLQEKEVRTAIGPELESVLTPRLYGAIAVGQLEEFKLATEEYSTAYARHFRITGQTCSLLMLDSEEDYKRFNIKPEEDAFVVKSKPAGGLVTGALAALDKQSGDPRAELLAWLEKLEKTPGVNFKLPTSLRLAIEKIPRQSFAIAPSLLNVKLRTSRGIPGDIQEQLASKQLDYDDISAEALRRRDKYGAADALRVLSSLVENNPGNTVVARDVGFSAMQWGLGGEAYHLFRRVAKSRPYEPQTYFAMARCLTDMKAADAAIVWYEVALAGQWPRRFGEFRRIAGLEYRQLLARIKRGELACSVPDYAAARLKSVDSQFQLPASDLVVVIGWNTDGTDVDLHVTEPNGETCFYSHTRTRAGGAITNDVTQGFGPEMYHIPRAGKGTYRVQVKYFSSDANRLSTRTRVYVTIYRHWGTDRQTVIRRAVTLRDGKEMHDIANVTFK